jgi:hypothetical protein
MNCSLGTTSEPSMRKEPDLVSNYLRSLRTLCDELESTDNPAVVSAGFLLIERAPTTIKELLQLKRSRSQI